MALTRDFKETVKARADRDPEFRRELLTQAMEAVVGGDIDVAKLLIRDYINATIGFECVGEAVEKDPKSLMRMLGDRGNPTAKNLFSITRYLQQDAGLQFKVVPAKASDTPKRKLARN